MATRRKYGPRKYKDGGSVSITVEEPIAQPAPVASADVTPPSAPAAQMRKGPNLPPSDPHDLDAVKRAVEAVRRAEEMQKELNNPQRIIDQYVDNMQGLSDHKKSFLKQKPMLLSEHVMPIAGAAWQQGLAQGIGDDTPEMNAHILKTVHRGIEARRQMAPPAVGPAPPPPQMPAYDRAEVERLQAEAAERLQAMKGTMPSPMPAPNLPPITPTKRSLPVSAPVSRDVPTASGAKTSQATTVTLTPEQREIAWSAYHWLSKPAAEAEYARQRLKLDSLRKAGIYPGPERN